MTIRAETLNWSKGQFHARAGAYEDRLIASIHAIFQAFTPDMTEDMMEQKYSVQRWQDHTGHARQGLIARAETKADGADLVLTANVPGPVQYNTMLELDHQGRYSTIIPTFQAYENELREAIMGLEK